MNNIKSTSKLVQFILETDERSRNNDGYLYCKVLDMCGRRDGISYISMPLYDFLPYVNSMRVPNSETVRRTRQKIQASFPELASAEKVAAMRAENEVEYKAYAVGVLTDD